MVGWRAVTPEEHVRAWFTARIPAGWFTGPPDVRVDREEILVVGTLQPGPDGAGPLAAVTRIKRFREQTREQRVRLAEEAEQLFERKVSWGAACGEHVVLFSTLAVPVMTRLRLGERAVLDTLIDAGVARSRSDALAWCVRLVGRHEADWIDSLRDALARVGELRDRGPRA